MTGNNIGLQKKRSSNTNYLLIPLCMVACVAIGYLLGSSTTILNSNIDNTKTMIAKVRTAESSIRNGNNSTNSTGETYTTANFAPRQPNHSTSIIEELIPTKLLPLYSHEKLQFNITRSMLRRSRPVVGNTQRLHAYLKKLQSKQCTTVLFLGGSGKLSYVDTLMYRHRCLLKTHTVIQLLPVIMVEGFQTHILVGSWIGSMNVTHARQVMEQLVCI